jgi:hypothetical protein
MARAAMPIILLVLICHWGFDLFIPTHVVITKRSPTKKAGRDFSDSTENNL